MNGYQCCFCGGDIETSEVDVSSLILITNWDKEDNQEDFLNDRVLTSRWDCYGNPIFFIL
jgi:hypothetical protein